MFDQFGHLTELASIVLEAHWRGMSAKEFAQHHGEDPLLIAAMMDTFRSEGW